MPVEHPEHQVIQDVRLHRGHDDTVATEDVAKYEALQMSVAPPAAAGDGVEGLRQQGARL